eukprot:COSAG01_NODE_3942_length_5509_cov_11.737893_4_plen_228_part_00
MIKALDGDKQLLLDQLRAVKRELQADVAEALALSETLVEGLHGGMAARALSSGGSPGGRGVGAGTPAAPSLSSSQRAVLVRAHELALSSAEGELAAWAALAQRAAAQPHAMQQQGEAPAAAPEESGAAAAAAEAQQLVTEALGQSELLAAQSTMALRAREAEQARSGAQRVRPYPPPPPALEYHMAPTPSSSSSWPSSSSRSPLPPSAACPARCDPRRQRCCGAVRA